MNLPSRRSNVDSFSLDCAADGRLIFHVWADFIQVIINIKMSDRIAIPLVRAGTATVSVNLSSTNEYEMWGTYGCVSSAHCKSDSAYAGNIYHTTHIAACGLADGEIMTLQYPSSMKKMVGRLFLY